MNKTGIIYDERMCLHAEDNHPEQPDRIKYIFNAIKERNLLESCTIIPIREATDDEILTVHDDKHLANMKNTASMNSYALTRAESLYNSIYLNNHSYKSALLSAGGVVELCDQVVTGRINNGIAIVRPPGHHAEPDCAMGFCLFNNVAVTAKTMIYRYGLKRIVILDWDVHHGNATQHMFESDPSVLYISIHRYDNGKFYPGSKDASPKMVGSGNGLGRNVNIAWNTKSNSVIGDTEYIYAYETLVKRMVEEYDPELIIISAGFDCAQGDPLGGMNVTPAGFNYMTQDLMKYAKGKIVIALEGGYNLSAISQSMVACLEALLEKDPHKLLLNDIISNVAISAVNETATAHKLYWSFLSKKVNY